MPTSPIEIVEATTPKQRTEFIHFQWVPYKDNPYWVPPLVSDRQKFLDKSKHPFHQHSEVALFLARRDEHTVGTIAAIINNRHNETHNENIGFFGLFECIEDYDVAEKLLSTARDWVKARGKSTLRGPANYSVNEEIGLLVDAFDAPPVILMTYNPRYYKDFIERFGFVKAMDLLAYFLDATKASDVENPLGSRLVRVAKKLQKRGKITIRQTNMKDFDREAEIIKKLYREAWDKNWGNVPMTDDEMHHLASDLKQLADPDFVLIVEIAGEPVGLALCLPDLNRPLRLAYPNPRTPEWWTLIKFLYHWKVRKDVNMVRVLLLGVLKKYRQRGIEAMLYMEIGRISLEKGIHEGEMSWILETNDLMRRGIEDMGGYVYKTYRLYDLVL